MPVSQHGEDSRSLLYHVGNEVSSVHNVKDAERYIQTFKDVERETVTVIHVLIFIDSS